MANSRAMCTSFKTEILSGIHASARPLRAAPRRRTRSRPALPDHGEHRRFHHGLFVHERACRDRQLHVGRGDGDERDGAHVFRHHGLLDALGVGVLDLFHVLRRVRRGAVPNSSQSNKAIAALTFSSQSITSGTFSPTMPTNSSSNALIRLT